MNSYNNLKFVNINLLWRNYVVYSRAYNESHGCQLKMLSWLSLNMYFTFKFIYSSGLCDLLREIHIILEWTEQTSTYLMCLIVCSCWRWCSISQAYWSELSIFCHRGVASFVCICQFFKFDLMFMHTSSAVYPLFEFCQRWLIW